MRAVVVTPTYNERENLEEFVARLRQSAPGVDLLVVDDNSPDGTGELADELSRRHPGEIAVLHRPRKQGLGRAYVAGFRKALAEAYDVVAQMDADLSHDPRYLPSMLERIETADLVLGSRYVRGIAVVNWDFKRLLLSKMATRYVQLVTGMPFTDATGGFKCWRREALEAIDLDRLFANGYLFQIETTYMAWRRGLRIAEVPIIFYERNLGRSKMDLRIISEAIWGVLRLRLRR
jgi:dolichol-phosphate mannosyltransferase